MQFNFMNHGPAWIIFEESHKRDSRALISILSPRRSQHDVARFMEQIYVDRHASIKERIQYKKSRNSATYRPVADHQVLHCGHDPFLVGVYARQTTISGNVLEFRYRIVVRRTVDPRNFEFEERRQVLSGGT